MYSRLTLLVTIVMIVFNYRTVIAQSKNNNVFDDVLLQLSDGLAGQVDLSFKEAVFLVENAKFNNRGAFHSFEEGIQHFVNLSILWNEHNKKNLKYRGRDYDEVCLRSSVFHILMDTTRILLSDDTLIQYPIRYDFDDIFGTNEQRFSLCKNS
jgi:hypothetical protein